MTSKRPDRGARDLSRNGLLHGRLTREIIGAFYEVYNVLGYGFLESVYAQALFLELTRRGLHVQREVMIDVYYKGDRVGKFRADMLVAYSVVVENKASVALAKSDRDQLELPSVQLS